MPSVSIAALVLIAVLLLMVVELQLSVAHERLLRAEGAVEPPDDVLRLMAAAYPASFVAMAAEAIIHGTVAREGLLVGIALLGVAKALKFWAIASLGRRWSFRVLVLPGAPLVQTGPYRFLRHPNYVAVLGELGSVAVALQAPVSGTLAVLGFGALLRRRIRVEEHALGLRGPDPAP